MRLRSDMGEYESSDRYCHLSVDDDRLVVERHSYDSLPFSDLKLTHSFPFPIVHSDKKKAYRSIFGGWRDLLLDNDSLLVHGLAFPSIGSHSRSAKQQQQLRSSSTLGYQ